MSEESSLWYLLYYRMICFFVRVALRFWVRFESHGSRNVPATGACIVASNHVSYLDPPALAISVRHRVVHFLARDTLMTKPLGKWFFNSIRVVSIDRTRGDVSALRKGIGLLKSGGVLGLFPEGTRSPSGEVQKAKGGIGFMIAKSSVAVVPAYVDGSLRVLPKGAQWFRRGRIRVFYGKPIEPSEFAVLGTDRAAYDRIGELVMSRIVALKPSSAEKTSAK